MNDRKIRVYVFQKKKIAHNCFFFAKVYLFIYFVTFFSFFFLFFSPYFCSYSSCSTYFFFGQFLLLLSLHQGKKNYAFFSCRFALVFSCTLHIFFDNFHIFSPSFPQPYPYPFSFFLLISNTLSATPVLLSSFFFFSSL